jgi:tRNA pseudouridine38-40 synthase
VPRFRVIVSYDGSTFHGSQVQPARRTVQGELERVILALSGSSVRVTLAGRTDAGVHAQGQVASFDVHWEKSPDQLQRALNAGLPDDLQVLSADEVHDRFDARRHAHWREYRYTVVESAAPQPLLRSYAWLVRPPIEAETVAEAARRFVGTHTFGSFTGLGKSRSMSAEQLTRTVFACRWSVEPLETPVGQSPVWVDRLQIVANGFLPQMVRGIVAAIVSVGRGQQPLEWVDFLLAANERASLGRVAPPQGLVLWQVGYEPFEDTIPA